MGINNSEIWQGNDKIENVNQIFDNTKQDLSKLKNNIENKQYTLSKEDFKKYFEWENFRQRTVWNCWLVAVIDSLVSYWDYEKLIRSSVKIDNKWFTFILPLWDPNWIEQFVSFKEIKEVQRDIYWNEQILISWKSWIKALAIAFWKLYSWFSDKLVYNNLDGWNSCIVFSLLVYDIDTYLLVRSGMSEKDDPNWTVDTIFTWKLRSILERFNTKTDMLTLSVNQLLGNSINVDDYSSLGHYSNSNHTVSVEKVIKKNWKLFITISNPWDSNRSYDILFEDLIKSCNYFNLWTKNKNYKDLTMDANVLYKSKMPFSNKKLDWDSIRIMNTNIKNNQVPYKKNGNNNIDLSPHTVDQIVSITWDADKALREARKEIIVTNDSNNKIKVSSYDLSINMEEKWWNVIISLWKNKLNINKSHISDRYKYDGKNIQDENFPFYLYWAKIANFINLMRKLYINKKSQDKSNDRPFRIINWSLQFDDNPLKLIWDKWRTRIWAELTWDDYIECLRNWWLLWISSSDNETKQKIADFLNKLIIEWN